MPAKDNLGSKESDGIGKDKASDIKPDPNAKMILNAYIPKQKRWTEATVLKSQSRETTLIAYSLERLQSTFKRFRDEVEKKDPVFWVQQVLKKDLGNVEQGLKF